MRKTILSVGCSLALTAGFAAAQPRETQLVDVLKVKVRSDKTMEYGNAIRKLADINRHKGEHWIAYSTEYGDSGTFTSRRCDRGMAMLKTALR